MYFNLLYLSIDEYTITFSLPLPVSRDVYKNNLQVYFVITIQFHIPRCQLAYMTTGKCKGIAQSVLYLMLSSFALRIV